MSQGWPWLSTWGNKNGQSRGTRKIDTGRGQIKQNTHHYTQTNTNNNNTCLLNKRLSVQSRHKTDSAERLNGIYNTVI